MSGTILLVEDNSDNRIIYRRVLEHFGYTVIEALDGEEAIRLATERVPDLILRTSRFRGSMGGRRRRRFGPTRGRTGFRSSR